MNIINRWVISRAEKIKAKAEAIKKAERKAEVNQYEFNRNLENKAKEILYRALDPIVQKMENEQYKKKQHERLQALQKPYKPKSI